MCTGYVFKTVCGHGITVVLLTVPKFPVKKKRQPKMLPKQIHCRIRCEGEVEVDDDDDADRGVVGVGVDGDEEAE